MSTQPTLGPLGLPTEIGGVPVPDTNPLTQYLTKAGGMFSGQAAGPTLSFAALATAPAAQQPSPIPGLSLMAFILRYGFNPVLPPAPFLSQLPTLTPAMASPIGPLSEYCTYAFAAQLVTALRTILTPDIKIPDGDDSASSGAIPVGNSSTWPGIYSPDVQPSGGGFEVTLGGVTYFNLDLRFVVTPKVGTPFISQNFNVVLIVRQFLNQPNNVQGVLTALENSILTGIPVPLV